jgi:heme oxygenase (biliverdin-producing, ferredoxin)
VLDIRPTEGERMTQPAVTTDVTTHLTQPTHLTHLAHPLEGPGRRSLAALLRAGTHDEHRRAESMPFVGALVEGRLDAAAYTDLLVQYRVVYAALETAGGRMRDGDRPGASLADPALDRRPALEADLTSLAGPGWQDLTVRPAGAAYAARVADVATGLPGYAAHAYTRYLGDLSGGLFIRAVLRRHGYADDALAFYDFPAIPKPKPYKDAYRSRLDALPLDAAQQDAVVAEARVAFDLTTALLAELGEAYDC